MVQPSTTSRSNGSRSSTSLKSTETRHSHPSTVPAIPPIPARFLDSARPSSHPGPLSRLTRPSERHDQTHPANDCPPSDSSHAPRPSTSHSDRRANDKRARVPLPTSSCNDDGVSGASVNASTSSLDPPNSPPQSHSPRVARRKPSLALPPTLHEQTLTRLEGPQQTVGNTEMARHNHAAEEDHFLELANDSSPAYGARQPAGGRERAGSRLSAFGKRPSLSGDSVLNASSSSDRRPKSSGSIFGRPTSRVGDFPSSLQRHIDRQRNSSSRASFRPDDVASNSPHSLSGRQQRFPAAIERSPISPSVLAHPSRSPDMPLYGRARPSFGATNQPAQGSHDEQDESPADSSEAKQSNADTTSVESTADTVWDELDELKSRIKKLELTGKLPSTSNAAVSGNSSERPRTATTAPTTIESSPKHESKPEAEPTQPHPAPENTISSPATSNIHPLLHSALAKAKPLLNASLYRSLEATASDALQLVAMTGSAGPQGTAFSAASITNGVTVSDRHVRRKADTMCRNLTDLCLALCEGKHETPHGATASPMSLATPVHGSLYVRHSRGSLGPPSDGHSRGNSRSRPLSRLEVRRSNILGLHPGSSGGSPRDVSVEDVSASEHESSNSTPSHQSRYPELRRTSRTSSRLLTTRQPRYEASPGDEDPTIRAPSRAMTDVGGGTRSLRAKPSGPRDFSPATHTEQRSPHLRDALATRRANAGAFESNHHAGLSRATSLLSESGSGRRSRFHRESSTPAVVEEDERAGGMEERQEQGYATSSSGVSAPSKRRITSLSGQLGVRRAGGLEGQGRATSLQLRKGVIVE